MFTILLTFLASVITDHEDGVIMALFLVGLLTDIVLICIYPWVCKCIEKLAIRRGHEKSNAYRYAFRFTWLGGLIYVLRLPNLSKAPKAEAVSAAKETAAEEAPAEL